MGLFSFLTQENAIDLGTANTLIIWNDKVVVDDDNDEDYEENNTNTSNTVNFNQQFICSK